MNPCYEKGYLLARGINLTCLKAENQVMDMIHSLHQTVDAAGPTTEPGSQHCLRSSLYYPVTELVRANVPKPD